MPSGNKSLCQLMLIQVYHSYGVESLGHNELNDINVIMDKYTFYLLTLFESELLLEPFLSPKGNKLSTGRILTQSPLVILELYPGVIQFQINWNQFTWRARMINIRFVLKWFNLKQWYHRHIHYTGTWYLILFSNEISVPAVDINNCLQSVYNIYVYVLHVEVVPDNDWSPNKISKQCSDQCWASAMTHTWAHWLRCVDVARDFIIFLYSC